MVTKQASKSKILRKVALGAGATALAIGLAQVPAPVKATGTEDGTGYRYLFVIGGVYSCGGSGNCLPTAG